MIADSMKTTTYISDCKNEIEVKGQCQFYVKLVCMARYVNFSSSFMKGGHIRRKDCLW